MTITLPEIKFVTYLKAISEMLSRIWTLSGELKANIGLWVHLGQIVSTVRHFFSRLGFLKQRAEKRRMVDINKQCQEDLNFLLSVSTYK
jgi:hypothetical protein